MREVYRSALLPDYVCRDLFPIAFFRNWRSGMEKPEYSERFEGPVSESSAD